MFNSHCILVSTEYILSSTLLIINTCLTSAYYNLNVDFHSTYLFR